jgi:hypothetical protein
MVKMLPPIPKEVGWWDDLLEENADEGLREVFPHNLAVDNEVNIEIPDLWSLIIFFILICPKLN